MSCAGEGSFLSVHQEKKALKLLSSYIVSLSLNISHSIYNKSFDMSMEV